MPTKMKLVKHAAFLTLDALYLKVSHQYNIYFVFAFIKVNSNNFYSTGLLCGADQFQLRDLEQACWKYIDRRVELGCGTIILNSVRAYSQHKKATEIRNDVSISNTISTWVKVFQNFPERPVFPGPDATGFYCGTEVRFPFFF